MRVSRIEAITKTKYKIYLDEQFAFVLYKGELFRYQIREGEEMPQQVYEEILEKVLLKRARLRALHLLEMADRTEAELCDRLKNSLYPEKIIEDAVSYVKSYGYVDDLRYAKNYIENRKGRKSRRELYALLQGKKLESSLIEKALDECYQDEDCSVAIREYLRRKRFDPEKATDTEKKKIYAALARKGFRYEDIRQIIQVY